MKTKRIEGEICVKAPCVEEEEEEEEERAPGIKSNREALQTAEKFLEYSRSKGNERHSLVLSKSTNLLQEIVLQNQKQATIHVFFGKYCEDTHQRTGRGGWGGCSPPSRGKNSIIRAKLMYRSGKETVKNILLFNILIYLFSPRNSPNLLKPATQQALKRDSLKEKRLGSSGQTLLKLCLRRTLKTLEHA